MIPRDILIVLPAYNESGVILQVIKDIQDAGYNNILVVDDGSTDETPLLLEKTRILNIRHITNLGAGAASQTGIEYGRRKGFSFLLLMDSDGQHHVEDIQLLISAIERSEHDIVIGNRFAMEQNEIPASRRFFNDIANIMTNFFCKKKYKDTQSGFRILNRRAIEKLDLKVDGFGFCSEMIIIAEHMGLSVGETPISVTYSNYSMSKGQSLNNGIKTAYNFMWRILTK